MFHSLILYPTPTNSEPPHMYFPNMRQYLERDDIVAIQINKSLLLNGASYQCEVQPVAHGASYQCEVQPVVWM